MTLGKTLETVGEDAEAIIPQTHVCCSCFGFFRKSDEQALKARILTLSTFNWLRHLGYQKKKNTIDDGILRAAVLVAEEFLAEHNQIAGIDSLHAELCMIVESYDIDRNDADTIALLQYSSDRQHVHVPKAIADWMKNHRLRDQISAPVYQMA